MLYYEDKIIFNLYYSVVLFTFVKFLRAFASLHFPTYSFDYIRIHSWSLRFTLILFHYIRVWPFNKNPSCSFVFIRDTLRCYSIYFTNNSCSTLQFAPFRYIRVHSLSLRFTLHSFINIRVHS